MHHCSSIVHLNFEEIKKEKNLKVLFLFKKKYVQFCKKAQDTRKKLCSAITEFTLVVNSENYEILTKYNALFHLKLDNLSNYVKVTCVN